MASVDASVLEYFFNAAPDLFAILSDEGAVSRANMAFRRFIGPASGASDASILSYLATASREDVKAALDRLNTSGGVEQLELQFRIGRDDHVISGEFSAAPNGSILFIGSDITRAQELEFERQDVDVNRSALEELAGIGHWRIIEDGGVEWSPGLYRIFGMSPGAQALQQDMFTEMILPDDRDRFKEAMQKGFSGSDFSCSVSVARPDGAVQYLEIAGAPSRDAFGRIIALQGVTVDKTGNVKALQEALETQSNLRGFMEASPMAVAMFDRDMRFLMVSDLWLEEGGWTREQLIGRRAKEVSPWLPDVFKDAHVRALEGEMSYADAERVDLPRDRVGWIRWSSTAWRDAAGAIAGSIFIKKDVTDLFEARAEVELSRERMTYGLDMSSMMIWELNFQSKSFNVEGDWRSFWASPPVFDEVEAQMWAAVHPADVDAIRGQWDRLAKTGVPLRHEHRIRNPAGRTIWVESTARIETDEKGRRLRMVGSLKDISAIKRMELKAREAEERSREANAVKSEFLANMSHEIRTPMNGVLAVAEVLAKTDLSEKQVDMAKLIMHSGKILLRLMDDLLEFARLEADQIEFDIRPFDLKDTINSACRVAETRARAKGLTFNCSTSAAMDGVFRGDAVRIGQILSNLLHNAVKFTETGGIEFAAEIDEDNEGVAMLTLVISDTGVGFDSEQESRLFERFEQAETGSSRSYGGAGLGLAIVKKLVDLMKGEVTATSAPGKGARFVVELPLTRDRIADLAPMKLVDAEDLSTETSLEGLSVLAAEDNPMNQRVLELIMEQAGVRVQFVENGEEAVEAVKADEYDVILMDLQMPIMDGETATRAIRAWETEAGVAPTPIIAVSANATPIHKHQAETAGCDAHIPKPVVQEVLFDAIARLVRPSAAAMVA